MWLCLTLTASVDWKMTERFKLCKRSVSFPILPLFPIVLIHQVVYRNKRRISCTDGGKTLSSLGVYTKCFTRRHVWLLQTLRSVNFVMKAISHLDTKWFASQQNISVELRFNQGVVLSPLLFM